MRGSIPIESRYLRESNLKLEGIKSSKVVRLYRLKCPMDVSNEVKRQLCAGDSITK